MICQNIIKIPYAVVSVCNLNPGRVAYTLNPRPRIKLAVKLPHYKIQEIKPFGTTEGINAYLKSRGVYSAAEGHM
jgi:hypothetical protein